MIVTLSTEHFDRDAGGARKAAEAGPVIITDAGCPTQVLLSIVEYRRLMEGSRPAIKAPMVPDAYDIDFDPPRLNVRLRLADFD